MDKKTHKSLTNAIKEIDSLKILVQTGNHSEEEISDFLSEISWNLSKVFQNIEYTSDEFQCRLIKYIKEK